MSASSPSVGSRVRELQEYISSGRIIDAMHEFYDPNVEMQENRNPPTRGLEANLRREEEFLAKVKVWKGYTVRSLSVGDDTSAVESVIEFIAQDDSPVKLEQVSIQRWKNGRIVSERFYYDSAS